MGPKKKPKTHEEDTFKHFNYPEEVLNHTCALVSNDVKGEILEDWYKVSLREWCEALQNKLLLCFIGSQFWKIYWKRLQQYTHPIIDENSKTYVEVNHIIA